MGLLNIILRSFEFWEDVWSIPPGFLHDSLYISLFNARNILPKLQRILLEFLDLFEMLLN